MPNGLNLLSITGRPHSTAQEKPCHQHTSIKSLFSTDHLPPPLRFRPISQDRRLVVVSNRLPVTFKKDGRTELSSGGLVTALVSVLNKRGGLWIGWSGTPGNMKKKLDRFVQDQAYGLHPVTLAPEDVDGFYSGFANQVLWPLFQGFPAKCVFKPDFWDAYDRVNHTFALEVANHTSESDYIWIHDYHPINVASKLKQTGEVRECGFYLHIPFPPPDLFLKLPWRQALLAGLLEYELVGFQTEWDRDNFLHTVRTMVPEARITPSGTSFTIRKGRNTTGIRMHAADMA